MKKLLVLLIPLMLLSYNSISQNIIRLTPFQARQVIKDLETKKWLEIENELLQLQVIQYEESESNCDLILIQKDSIIFDQKQQIQLFVSNQETINNSLDDAMRINKKLTRKNKVLTGLASISIILTLVIAVK